MTAGNGPRGKNWLFARKENQISWQERWRYFWHIRHSAWTTFFHSYTLISKKEIGGSRAPLASEAPSGVQVISGNIFRHGPPLKSYTLKLNQSCHFRMSQLFWNLTSKQGRTNTRHSRLKSKLSSDGPTDGPTRWRVVISKNAVFDLIFNVSYVMTFTLDKQKSFSEMSTVLCQRSDWRYGGYGGDIHDTSMVDMALLYTR